MKCAGSLDEEADPGDLARQPFTKSVMKASTPSRANLVRAVIFIALGIALGVAGIYIGETDDSPGAGGLGLVLMVLLVTLGVRAARRKA